MYNFRTDLASERRDIYKKAKIIGKWFGKVGDTKTIYAAIGIKP